MKGDGANNTISAAAAALQMSNFHTFRLLWSTECNTLSIHFVNLNPYHIQTSGSANFKKQMQETYDILRSHTFEPISVSPQKCCTLNKLSNDDPPIFLQRKRREAKQISKSYGLNHRITPVLGTIIYDEKTEDILQVRKSKLNVHKTTKIQMQRS